MTTTVRAYPHLRGAEAALADGELDTASAMVIRHLRENRNEPRGLALLGSIALKSGALVQAEQFLRQAMALGAVSFEIQRELAAVLHHQERLAEAFRALDALYERTNDPDVRMARAQVLEKLGRGEEALAEHQALIEIFPDNPRPLLAYGNALRWAGRNEEAIAALRRSVSIDPEYGDGWWALANIKEKVLTDEDVATMKAALRLAIDERNIVPIHFALGRAANDRKQYAEAFEHFETANRLRAESINFQSKTLSAEVDEVIQAFDADFYGPPGWESTPDRPVPIFLVSMPRAGSTLLEQMLDQHDDIEAVGELGYLRAILRSALEIHTRRRPVTVPQMVLSMSRAEAEAYGQDYMERASLHWKSRPRYFIDKMPMNWTEIPFIRKVLPQARFIGIRRDAMDCCFSNFTHYFSRAHGSSFSLQHIGAAYVDHVRMWENLRLVAPWMIDFVRYEELVADPEPVLRKTLAYLDLDWNPALLRFYESERTVRTPSVEQVRQPLNRKGMGAWLPYRQWLGPLIEALGPFATEELADTDRG
jgi:tetratricopeptide (TPR) repeat protein